MTTQQLKEIIPDALESHIETYAPILTVLMQQNGINNKLRECHFIAQIAHESGSLTYVKELASGKAYEGRKDLGNIHPGDGVKFKGRGLIQITGRKNYLALSLFLFKDNRLLTNPKILEEPKYAVLSAIWFWNSRNLNSWADKDNFKVITRLINGGYNGLADRLAFLNRAKKVLN